MFFHHRARLLLGVAAVSISALLHSNPGFAETVTGTLNVTASVQQDCELGTISTLDFDVYEPGQPNVAQADIVVNCNTDGTVTVDLDDGQNSTTAGQRAMKQQNGSDALIRYQIYTTSTRNDPWTEPRAVPVTGGDDIQVTAFGAILHTLTTSAPPGEYSDSVTVTVSF